MNVLDRFDSFYKELTASSTSKLSSIYSDDVVLQDPVGTHRGLSEVTAYFNHLLSSAQTCSFTIHRLESPSESQSEYIAYAVWTMELLLNERSSPLLLEGMSQLKVVNDRITYHRDYYDLGEMVYEHIPVLGWLIKKIKQRLQP